MGYTVLKRGFGRNTGRPSRVPPERIGQTVVSGVKSVQKTLDTLDKMHETRVKNTGLLDSVNFSHSYTDKNTGIQNIPMFKRADQDASLNPFAYYKRTTTPTFQRIKINPAIFDIPDDPSGNVQALTWTDVHKKLLDEGFDENQILDIVSNSNVP